MVEMACKVVFAWIRLAAGLARDKYHRQHSGHTEKDLELHTRCKALLLSVSGLSHYGWGGCFRLPVGSHRQKEHLLSDLSVWALHRSLRVSADIWMFIFLRFMGQLWHRR